MEYFCFSCPSCHELTAVKENYIAGQENYECETCHAIIGVRLSIVQPDPGVAGDVTPLRSATRLNATVGRLPAQRNHERI